MEELWQRVSQGRHTALLGIVPGEPPAALGIRVVRVRCDVPRTTLGPLLEAQRKVDLLLGGAPLIEQARSRVLTGLRRRLLGDVPEDAGDAALLEAMNRLGQQADLRYALALDAVEESDEATLDALRRIVSRPDALRVPLVLSFRTPEPLGAAGTLVAALRSAGGAEAVLRTVETEVLAAEVASHGPAAAWRSLPPDVLRVLRAGALVGSGFETELLASLLDVEAIDVLEALQRAADAGLPIEDRGEGRFHLPGPLLSELRSSVLPSLARAWHRRLAHLLGEDAGAPSDDGGSAHGARFAPSVPAEAIEEAMRLTRPPGDAPHASTQPEAEAPQKSPSVPPAPEWPYAEIFPRGAEPKAHATPAPSDPAARPEPERAAPPRSDPGSERAAPPRSDPGSERAASPPRSRPGPRAPERAAKAPARAATHLTAAGDLDAAAQRYCAAAAQAATAGAYPQALAYGQQALALLENLPATAARRRLRVAALAEIARVHWQAAGRAASSPPDADPSPDGGRGLAGPSFTLAGALDVLKAARSLLAPDDPPALFAEVATLIADVCYDLGDLASLERALEELTDASRRLLTAGDPQAAARLLNDQAAVYVRMGDPVRAAHLLAESRKVFEQRAAVDPVALIELAETDHLFARIPLHVAGRPGREDDALSMGLDHALAAERTYRKLGATRELGRVWETMGRLELRKQRIERAKQRLSAALEVQQATGDLVGLARSTAALSEVLAAEGRHHDALLVLADSIALNLEKGSPIGLAFNRRALTGLSPSVAPHGEVAETLRKVAAQLAAAEGTLGRIHLAGERD